MSSQSWRFWIKRTGFAPDNTSWPRIFGMSPELLSICAWTLLKMGVTFVVGNPIMVLHVRPTITLDTASLVLNNQLPVRTGSAGELLNARALGRIINEIFEAVAFGGLWGGIVGKILASWTRSWRFLFKTFLGCRPIIDIPFGFAVATSAADISVQIEEFTYKWRVQGSPIKINFLECNTFFTGSLRKLSVASLMRWPPMPVIKSFAIFFVFASCRTIWFED